MAKPDRKSSSPPRVLADLWRTLRREMFSTYHPERHYMRGPGPKWQAKHAVPASSGVGLGDAMGATH